MSEIEFKDVFMGRVETARYEVRRSGSIVGYDFGSGVIREDRLLEYREICRVNLSCPELQVGDRIHINEIDSTVLIKDKMRTTDNEIIYYTNHIIKVVEDGESKESRMEAIELLKIIQEDERVLNNKSRNKWWQFWK